MFSQTALRALALGFMFFLLNCSGGGNDNKPQPPPTPVYYEVAVSCREGTSSPITSLQVKSGEKASIPANLLAGYNSIQATTDPAGASGSFVQGVAPGNFNYNTGAITSKTTVVFSASKDVVQLYSISGKSGASGATATLSPGGITSGTDAGGYFHLNGVANGIYEVTMSLPGFNFTPSSRTVTVSGADVTGVDFTATSANPFVNEEISVLKNGNQCIVFAESSSYSGNVVKAGKYVLYRKDPGSSNFAFFGQFTRTQDLPPDAILSSQFTNVVPLASIEGTVFKVEIEELVSGLKTSVTTTVSSQEQFQAVALPDGKSIKITFPGNSDPFVVYVYKMLSPWPGRYLSAPLFPSQDGVVVVPEGYPTTGSPVVVVVGYPNAVSYTSYVK